MHGWLSFGIGVEESSSSSVWVVGKVRWGVRWGDRIRKVFCFSFASCSARANLAVLIWLSFGVTVRVAYQHLHGHATRGVCATHRRNLSRPYTQHHNAFDEQETHDTSGKARQGKGKAIQQMAEDDG